MKALVPVDREVVEKQIEEQSQQILKARAIRLIGLFLPSSCVATCVWLVFSRYSCKAVAFAPYFSQPGPCETLRDKRKFAWTTPFLALLY